MNDLIYKNVLLSSKEIRVLAAYCGIETLRIMTEYRQEELDPQEVNETIFQLYQKGILCWNGENQYILQDEIKALFRDVKYAAKELEIRSKSQKSPLHCFWNKEMVVTEISQNDVDRIKMHRAKQEEFLEELLERGMVPKLTEKKKDESEQEEWKDLWVNFQKKYSEILQDVRRCGEQMENLLSEEKELKAYIIVYDRMTGKGEQTILFLADAPYGCMVVLEKNAIYAENLNVTNLQKLFSQQIEEGDDRA